VIERPGEDFDDMIACDQADEHCEAERHYALDEHPTKVLQVLEERLYRAALFLLVLLDVLHGFR